MTPNPGRSPSLVRAEVVGLAFAMAAVVFRRPDILVLAAPLLLYAAWAEFSRPDSLTIGLRQGSGRVAMGSDTDVVATLVESGFITLARPRQPGVSSPDGWAESVADTRAAMVRVTVQAWGKRNIGPLTIVASDR